MNIRLFTGFLMKAAEDAWRPATATAPASLRVVFEAHVKDSKGTEFVEHCVIENEALAKRTKGLLVPGRSVIIHGECTARPYKRADVLMGFVRETIVNEIEIPNRAAAPTEKCPAPSTPVPIPA